MAELKIHQEDTGAEFRLALEGSIDEDVDFSTVDLSGKSAMVVDFEKVSAINSCGIREWIKLISTASGAEKIRFIKCPKIIVDQINMVDGFLPGNGRVESFYVPYYSDESGEEKSVLFSHGAEFDDDNVNPPDVNDSNGDEMEIDIIEAKYFKFLKK